MESMTTVQARIPDSLKQQAVEVFQSVGLTPSDAIRIFFQQAVNTGGIPFMLQGKKPNAATLAAMQDLENGGGQRFTDNEKFYSDLGI